MKTRRPPRLIVVRIIHCIVLGTYTTLWYPLNSLKTEFTENASASRVPFWLSEDYFFLIGPNSRCWLDSRPTGLGFQHQQETSQRKIFFQFLLQKCKRSEDDDWPVVPPQVSSTLPVDNHLQKHETQHQTTERIISGHEGKSERASVRSEIASRAGCSRLGILSTAAKKGKKEEGRERRLQEEPSHPLLTSTIRQSRGRH